MKLPRETMLELMAFADGELAEADRPRLERLVTEDEDARRLVDSIRRPDLGTWLHEGLDARAASAGADAVADTVMARIAVDRARAAETRKRRPARSSRLELSIGAGVAALALAAGVALYVHSQGRPSDDGAPVASVGVPPVDFQPPSALANAKAAAVPGGVELDEIDAPRRGVSVFEIPAAAGAALANPSHGSTIVVWVDEEPGPK